MNGSPFEPASQTSGRAGEGSIAGRGDPSDSPHLRPVPLDGCASPRLSAPRAIVDRAKAARAGRLTITIGTGCCESTAPFLYEDFWPGPDQAEVGEVSGVAIYAPEYLRQMYPGADGVVIDVSGELADSMSIETEFGCRLVLRGPGFDSATEPQTVQGPRRITGPQCGRRAPAGAAPRPDALNVVIVRRRLL